MPEPAKEHRHEQAPAPAPNANAYRMEYFLGADNESGAIDQGAVLAFLAEHVRGATVTFGLGLWEGQVEACATITVFAQDPAQTEGLADLLAARFSQDSVLEAISPARIAF